VKAKATWTALSTTTARPWTSTPPWPLAYDHRGLIEEQKNDLDGAIADSTQALELNPKDPVSYCDRGLARLGKGDLDGALGDLRNFIGSKMG
jgi:tetratricopeptide (TPR) repeat protein